MVRYHSKITQKPFNVKNSVTVIYIAYNVLLAFDGNYMSLSYIVSRT